MVGGDQEILPLLVVAGLVEGHAHGPFRLVGEGGSWLSSWFGKRNAPSIGRLRHVLYVHPLHTSSSGSKSRNLSRTITASRSDRRHSGTRSRSRSRGRSREYRRSSRSRSRSRDRYERRRSPRSYSNENEERANSQGRGGHHETSQHDRYDYRSREDHRINLRSNERKEESSPRRLPATAVSSPSPRLEEVSDFIISTHDRTFGVFSIPYNARSFEDGRFDDTMDVSTSDSRRIIRRLIWNDAAGAPDPAEMITDEDRLVDLQQAVLQLTSPGRLQLSEIEWIARPRTIDRVGSPSAFILIQLHVSSLENILDRIATDSRDAFESYLHWFVRCSSHQYRGVLHRPLCERYFGSMALNHEGRFKFECNRSACTHSHSHSGMIGLLARIHTGRQMLEATIRRESIHCIVNAVLSPSPLPTQKTMPPLELTPPYAISPYLSLSQPSLQLGRDAMVDNVSLQPELHSQSPVASSSCHSKSSTNLTSQLTAPGPQQKQNHL